ncbi:MAG: beta-N-acetylhexosaminidase [candidate division KSB1 bacterium]|nr:beta-N-acetylhexosaminidase [candidate division KSB1 bacterium]
MGRGLRWVPVVLLCLFAAAGAADLNLVPKPVEARRLPGWFSFVPGELGIVLGARASAEDSFACELLRDEIQSDFGQAAPLGPRARNIYLTLPSRDRELSALCAEAGSLPDSALGDQGYVLVVQPRRIVVAANSSRGLFYGVQTLRQLVRGNAVGHRIPCLRIRDYPVFRYRGQQDDLSRGPVRTLEYLKQEIRRLAELKLNLATYYTEHIFRTRSHPEFAPPGGALTPEEVAELAQYARKYHVELIGNFQAFGHFRNILKHPKFEHLGESDWVLSPALKESYALLEDLLREIAPAYPGLFFNVNCDETWGLGTGASKSIVEEKGIAAVYASHLNWLHDQLTQYGKRMMMWGDIALTYPDILSLLRPDIIMLSWGYDPRASFVEAIRPFRKAGFEVFVCPGLSCWNRLFPDFETARINIHNYVRDGIQEGAVGMLNTAWYDEGEGFFSLNWYGVAFAAEQAWNPQPLEDTTFGRRFSAAVYGDRENRVGRAVESLSALHHRGPPEGIWTRVFWKPLLGARGSRHVLGVTGWDGAERVDAVVSQLLEGARATHYVRDLAYLRHAAERIALIPALRKGVLRAASAYRQACLSPLGSEGGAAHLREALSAIADARRRLFSLRQQYAILWLGENRVWWLENNLAKFDEVLEDLRQVEDWLTRATWDWEKGQPIPAPRDIRLDVEELSGDFFRSWLICGAFRNPRAIASQAPGQRENCGGMDIDYLEPMGGEAQVRPRPGETVELPGGGKARWEPVEAPGSTVDLQGRFAEEEYVSAYAYCELELRKPLATRLLVGSNDDLRIYVNGVLVHENRRSRRLTVDEDVVSVQFSPGVNRILVKIGQCGGAWGFSFRIQGLSVRNEGHRYIGLESN